MFPALQCLKDPHSRATLGLIQVSSFGASLHVATLGLVVYQNFGPIAAGWALALRIFVQALAAPWAGRLSDRGGATRVLRRLELVIVAANLALALTLLLGESLAAVLVLSAVVGAARGGESPTLSKYAIGRTDPSKRAAVLGLQGVTADIANTAAPLAAAAALAWFSPVGFIVSASTSAFILLQLRKTASSVPALTEPTGTQLRRWMPDRAWWAVALSTAAVCLFAAQMPMLPLALADGSASMYAGAASVFALGTGIGAVGTLSWKNVSPVQLAAPAALTGCAWLAGAGAAWAFGSSLALTATAALIAGIACGAQFTAASTALLEVVDPEHQGQARGAYLAVTWVASAAGALCLGVIAETSRSAVPWVAGASAVATAFVAAGVWGQRRPLPKHTSTAQPA